MATSECGNGGQSKHDDAHSPRRLYMNYILCHLENLHLKLSILLICRASYSMHNIGDQSHLRMDTFPLVVRAGPRRRRAKSYLNAIFVAGGQKPVVFVQHVALLDLGQARRVPLHLMVDGRLLQHLVGDGNSLDAMGRNASQTYINLT